MLKYLTILCLVLTIGWPNVKAANNETVTLVQDSIKTEVTNTKSIVTIYLTVSQSANLQLGFWIMGVKHSDNTYSSYSIKLNGQSQTGYLQTSKGDWQYISTTGQTLFSFACGNNVIQIEGTVNDIPNIGYVEKYRVPSFAYNPNNFYSLEKSHRHKYSYEVNNEIDYNKDYHFYSVLNDSLYPPTMFTGHLKRETFYTFYREEYYSAGQTVTFQTDTIGNVHHVIHVFSKSDPQNHSWSASSKNAIGGHAELLVNISKSDFYYVLVRSCEENSWGTCNLCIDNCRIFENIPINNNRTDINVQFSNANYACFSKGLNADPMILLIDNDSIGRVINYNDDYPYNASSSSYDWKTSARFNQPLSNDYWVLTIPKSSSNFFPCYFDTYTGCKMADYMGSGNGFPNMHLDDYLVSSFPTSRYNCISWALGEWMIGYWLDNFAGEDHDIEAIDSLFSIYEFTREGATESNADIDLWATINSDGSWCCTHTSVKSKRQKYAAGYDWESKLGSSERIFHPRNALSGGQYGEIVAHYKKNTIPPFHPWPCRIIRNIELGSTEEEYINSTKQLISEEIKDKFDNLYKECVEESKIRVSIFIRQYEKTAQYRCLLEYCLKNPELLPLILQKVNDDEVLGVKLLFDMTKKEYSQIWSDVRSEISKCQRTEEDIPIVYTLQSQARLFIKIFINMIDVADALKESSTYSNDFFFDIKNYNNNLSLSFFLNKDSRVSLSYADIYGGQIVNMVSSILMDKGNHEISLPRLKAGVYSVCIRKDNSLYEKTIAIK